MERLSPYNLRIVVRFLFNFFIPPTAFLFPVEASRIQPPLPSSGTSCRFTHGLTISVNSSSTKGYQDLSKHILANATTEVSKN